ncbi:hypothetical protein Tco_1556595 [Tanacetum coccineum]
MRTRSSSNLIVESSTIPRRRNRRRSKQIVKPELQTIIETLVATMADTRTMSELLQAPIEGYGDAIVLPPILAENFELKVGLLTLTTNLKNDIMNFQQRFDETFSEAWDRFKDLLPAGGNLLNCTPRDALTIIKNKSKVRTSRNKPVVLKMSATTSSSTPAYLSEIAALTDAVKAMLLQNKTPLPTLRIPSTSSSSSKGREREPEATRKGQNYKIQEVYLLHVHPLLSKFLFKSPKLSPETNPKTS